MQSGTSNEFMCGNGEQEVEVNTGVKYHFGFIFTLNWVESVSCTRFCSKLRAGVWAVNECWCCSILCFLQAITCNIQSRVSLNFQVFRAKQLDVCKYFEVPFQDMFCSSWTFRSPQNSRSTNKCVDKNRPRLYISRRLPQNDFQTPLTFLQLN